jgi:NAD(P)-dependent dehydrogenase (short-subunit alcohol dehydrogenase family)
MGGTKKNQEIISLEGKVAIITGGASGIGLASAKRLAEAGAAIALGDINESKGRTAVMEIQELGAEARLYVCDVTSDSDCRRTAEQIFGDFGRIDILFNNAGIIWRKSVTELTEEEWDAVLDVNLKAVFLFSRYVIPLMAKSGEGSIINTGSGWGLKGGANAAAYCAAKGGVVNLTRAMAIDHGKQGIRVNCICPGDTDTELLHEEAVQLGLPEWEFMKEAADRPLQRVGLPEDIANAVLYFASDLSSWVTGSILVVDGGGIA